MSDINAMVRFAYQVRNSGGWSTYDVDEFEEMGNRVDTEEARMMVYDLKRCLELGRQYEARIYELEVNLRETLQIARRYKNAYSSSQKELQEAGDRLEKIATILEHPKVKETARKVGFKI